MIHNNVDPIKIWYIFNAVYGILALYWFDQLKHLMIIKKRFPKFIKIEVILFILCLVIAFPLKAKAFYSAEFIVIIPKQQREMELELEYGDGQDWKMMHPNWENSNYKGRENKRRRLDDRQQEMGGANRMLEEFVPDDEAKLSEEPAISKPSIIEHLPSNDGSKEEDDHKSKGSLEREDNLDRLHFAFPATESNIKLAFKGICGIKGSGNHREISQRERCHNKIYHLDKTGLLQSYETNRLWNFQIIEEEKEKKLKKKELKKRENVEKRENVQV